MPARPETSLFIVSVAVLRESAQQVLGSLPPVSEDAILLIRRVDTGEVELLAQCDSLAEAEALAYSMEDEEFIAIQNPEAQQPPPISPFDPI